MEAKEVQELINKALKEQETTRMSAELEQRKAALDAREKALAEKEKALKQDAPNDALDQVKGKPMEAERKKAILAKMRGQR